METIESLGKKMEYPGRVLIIQENKEYITTIYAVTARSDSSKAKRYLYNEQHNIIHVVPTDADVMAQGDLSLLDYTAVIFLPNQLIIGNGRQTNAIKKDTSQTANNLLSKSLKDIEFEHDKYSTPRITGAIIKTSDNITKALHIIRNDGSGLSTRDSYDLSSKNDKGYFMSTYNGENIRPTPSFEGGPITISFCEENLKGITQRVYAALNSKLIVSVITVQMDKSTGLFEHHIINAL